MAQDDTIFRARLAADVLALEQLECELADLSQRRDKDKLHIAELQRAVAEADADICDVTTHRDVLKRSIQRRQAGLAPRSLPTFPHELLGMIFKHSIDDQVFDVARTRQPFQCAAVCRRWRSTALETPSLWTYVYVPCFSLMPVGNRWKNHVRHLLVRSCACPLDVAISLSHQNFVFDCYQAILSDLMLHCDRWWRLNISGHVVDTTRLEILGLLRGRTPLLESVTFSFGEQSKLPWPEDMPEYLPYAPKLRSASFSNAPIAFTRRDGNANSVGLLATSLTLDEEFYRVERFAQTVMAFPALTTLEVVWSDCLAWPLAAESIRLPELQTLILIRPEDDDMTTDFDSFSHIVDALEVPKLRVLGIVPELLGCAEGLLGRCAATVEVLRLRRGSLDEADQADILTSLDALREISFDRLYFGPDFLNTLRGMAPTIWPKLERFVLHELYESVTRDVDGLLLHFLRDRYPVNATGPAACALLEVAIDIDNHLSGSFTAAEIRHILDIERERRSLKT